MTGANIAIPIQVAKAQLNAHHYGMKHPKTTGSRSSYTQGGQTEVAVGRNWI